MNANTHHSSRMAIYVVSCTKLGMCGVIRFLTSEAEKLANIYHKMKEVMCLSEDCVYKWVQ